MIVDLPGTTTNDVNRRLVALREEQGVSTMGRVLTLVVSVTAESVLEESIAAANDASREHPCRVILVSPADASAGDPRLDAQIRVGRDGGAGRWWCCGCPARWPDPPSRSCRCWWSPSCCRSSSPAA
nr:glucose-6-phosphate dehydrogenase assembly protein OpcA [Mycolicibacterium insubricum]